MAKVRLRKKAGMLYLDFSFKGRRCREQTRLPDTPVHRKQLEALLEGIEREMAQGRRPGQLVKNRFPVAGCDNPC